MKMRKLEVIERASPASMTGEPVLFEKLRELTRTGYVPDAEAEPSGGGMLLRHESAPDLILNADGSIDLPTGHATKRRRRAATPAREKRVYWRRTFFVTIVAVAVWFLSVALAAGFLEMIAD